MLREVIITVGTAIIMTLTVIAMRRALILMRRMLVIRKAEAEAADNKAAASAYEMALKVLDSITDITVSRIEATQAAAVRKAVKNGEKAFTELTKFSEDAYQDIVAQLSPYVMASLEACVGNTERLIRNKIEEVLPKVKHEYRSLENQDKDSLPWDTCVDGGEQ